MPEGPRRPAPQHKTKDIAEAARPARSRLSQDILRLQRYEEKVQRNINEVQIRRQDLQDKCLAIETDIRSRHETIVAAADQYHAEALASLEAVTSDIEAGQLSDLDRLQSNLQALTELRDRIQQALDSGAASNLVSASWAMRSGRGSEKALAELMKNQVTTVQHPVLHFTSLSPPFFHSMRDFVGSVSRLEMKVLSVPEGTIVERFRYGQDNNLEVYSLCPLEDGSVWVAFEPHLHLGELSPCRLGRAGEVLGTSDRFVGRVTFAPVSQSLCLFLASTTEKDSTYAKRQGMSVQRYWMENSHIHAENPHTGQTMKFNINCRSHRAFDASGRKNLFVVLKEPKAPHQQRKVRLYGLHMFRAIAKYRPPETAFRPSDVCFYTLGGQEVLLVADELNNAIHVVDVQRKRGLAGYVSKWSYELNFSRYLAPGCPLLVQPTALNTDTSGRFGVMTKTAQNDL
nr:hypothetical protein BaRGS_008326 [Batillaria attramentaria]